MITIQCKYAGVSAAFRTSYAPAFNTIFIIKVIVPKILVNKSTTTTAAH